MKCVVHPIVVLISDFRHNLFPGKENLTCSILGPEFCGNTEDTKFMKHPIVRVAICCVLNGLNSRAEDVTFWKAGVFSDVFICHVDGISHEFLISSVRVIVVRCDEQVPPGMDIDRYLDFSMLFKKLRQRLRLRFRKGPLSSILLITWIRTRPYIIMFELIPKVSIQVDSRTLICSVAGSGCFAEIHVLSDEFEPACLFENSIYFHEAVYVDSRDGIYFVSVEKSNNGWFLMNISMQK
jgi:hypothetical protein